MVLKITTSLVTPSGLSVASSYARVTSVDPQDGTQLTPTFHIYTSEDDFINGFQQLTLIDPTNPSLTIPGSFQFPYNRQTDGVDTLMFCHTGIQAALTAMGITSTIEGLN